MTIIEQILQERQAQDAKWGVQNHETLYWLGILCEEMGEVAKEMIEGEPSDLWTELIQVAAVAIAALECLQRRGTDR